jgi:putative ABC transport system permease protein
LKTVSIEGYTPRRDEDLAFMFNAIAGDYFRTLHIPIEAGRAFNDHDDETGGRVVIVNDTLARRFWGGAEQAIGRRITTGDGAWRTIVGVAQDIKYVKINETPRPYFYLPFFQSYRTAAELNTRGASAPDALAARAREQVAALDADLPVLYAKPLTERIAGTRIIFKLTAMMLLIFGTTGLMLAGLGTYGLVSYTVRQSTHEIGIRLALGASAFSVVRGFLSRGLRLGAIGAVIGIVVALAGGRLIESALFGVSATDPGSFTRALAIVLGGVLLATLVPAWRASRTDPLRALRRS